MAIYKENILQIDALREYALIDYIVYRFIAPQNKIYARNMVERELISRGGEVEKGTLRVGTIMPSDMAVTNAVREGFVNRGERHGIGMVRISSKGEEDYNSLLSKIDRNANVLSDEMRRNVYNMCILLCQYFFRISKDNPPSLSDLIFLLNETRLKLLDKLDNDPSSIAKLVFLSRVDLLESSGYPVNFSNIRGLIPSKNMSTIRTMYNYTISKDRFLEKNFKITEKGREFIDERIRDINRRIDNAANDDKKKEPLEYFLKGIALLDKIAPIIIKGDITFNNSIDEEQVSRKWPAKKELFEEW